MIPYDPAAWRDLFEAVASASAALAGLIFVAVSFNIKLVLDKAALPGRAANALLVLVSLVLVSLLGLVPGQPRDALGGELTVIGAVLVVELVRGSVHRRRHRIPNQPRNWNLVPFVFMLLSSIPLALAGLSVMVGAGGGLYWLVPALVGGFAGSVYSGWVLLVEILR